MRLGLLNSTRSSNRNTCLWHFFLPYKIVNSSWRTNCPCSFRFTWKSVWKMMKWQFRREDICFPMFLHVKCSAYLLCHTHLHHSLWWRPWRADRCHGEAGIWPSRWRHVGTLAPAPGPQSLLWSGLSAAGRTYSCAGWASAGTTPGPSYPPTPAAYAGMRETLILQSQAEVRWNEWD